MKRHHLYLSTAIAASAVLGLWLGSERSASAPESSEVIRKTVPHDIPPARSSAPPSARLIASAKPESTIGRPLHRSAAAPQKKPTPITVGTPFKHPQLRPEEHKALAEIQDLALTLRRYGQRFGGNPVGTNAEITRDLNGGNPAQVRLLPGENKPRLNPQGELLDPWGTPYFFHQVSAAKTEVISAGADHRLHTHDDLKR